MSRRAGSESAGAVNLDRKMDDLIRAAGFDCRRLGIGIDASKMRIWYSLGRESPSSMAPAAGVSTCLLLHTEYDSRCPDAQMENRCLATTRTLGISGPRIKHCACLVRC